MHSRWDASAQWMRCAAQPLVIAIAAFLALRPFIALLHELIILAMANLLRWVANLPVLQEWALAAPFDPIYSLAAIEMMGRARAAGIAVASPVGDLLSAVLPAHFVSATPSQTAWAQVVMEQGTTVMPRIASVFVADVALFGLGFALVWRSARSFSRIVLLLKRPCRRLALLVLGAGVLIEVAARVIADPPSPSDVESAGVSFALGVLMPWATGRQMAISDLQTLMPDWLFRIALSMVALLATFVVTALVALAVCIANRALTFLTTRIPVVNTRPIVWQRVSHGAVAGAAAFLMLAMLATQTGPAEIASAAGPLPAVAPAPMESPRDGNISSLPVSVVREEDRSAPVQREAPPAAPPGPSTVSIVGRSYFFSYYVNGQPEFIKGMGYNPIYAKLPPDVRAANVERDLALMHQNGVNTVYGWINAEFDQLTLDVAQAHGLGVAMPYSLLPTADYTNANVRAALAKDVLAWVEAHRRHPALRMWAIGNEVLHKIVFPSWLPFTKNSPQSVALAKGFASFYVDLIDQVHRADPGHPVILRDAEDSYLGWIRDALQARPAERRWFFYGVNIYTSRLTQVVDGWPRHKVDVPLLISEFAPAGLAPKDRPDGYRRMWQTILRQPNWIVGGVPYVWTTAGPEEVDRAFGLTDANAKPVDGSLDAIGQVYRKKTEYPIAVSSLPRRTITP